MQVAAHVPSYPRDAPGISTDRPAARAALACRASAPTRRGSYRGRAARAHRSHRPVSQARHRARRLRASRRPGFGRRRDSPGRPPSASTRVTSDSRAPRICRIALRAAASESSASAARSSRPSHGASLPPGSAADRRAAPTVSARQASAAALRSHRPPGSTSDRAAGSTGSWGESGTSARTARRPRCPITP